MPKLPEDIQEKWDDLDKRIKEAKKDTGDNDKDIVQEISKDAEKSATAGATFLSTVIAGFVLGFGIDWYFQTTPWGIIFFICMGFVTAVIRANQVMKKNAEENENS